MSGQVVLLGRKMKDCRFRRTEEKILAVFFDGGCSTMKQIAKKVGVGCSTIYTHHHTTREILPDWERYILAEYRLMIQKKKQIKNVKTLYFEMLIFIMKNRKFFEVFLKFGNREILMKMIFSMKYFKRTDRVFRICASEISEVIFEWGEKGFSEREFERVLSDIVYLTLSMRDRLLPLCK